MSAKSSGSVYSQDSYRSPFVPVLDVDTRRQAVVFSASLQWTDLSDEGVDLAVAVKDPLRPASMVELPPVASKEYSPPTLGSDVSILPLPSAEAFSADNRSESQARKSTKLDTARETSSTKLKENKTIEEVSNSKRISKHSKAFGKFMSRMSLQPSKKELSEKRQANALSLNVVHLASGYKLPEIRTPGPIRMSFIVQPSPPAVPALPVILPSVPDVAPVENLPRLYTQPSGSTNPSLFSTPAHPAKKGHRRYRSSPAITNFNFKSWDVEDMPPLPIPAMPLSVATPAGAPIPTRPRPRTLSFTKAKPVVRAISPPVPLRSGQLLLG